MKKSKILVFMISVILSLTIFILPTFAAPTPMPSVTLTGGTLSVNNTILLSQAITAQYNFIRSSGLATLSVEPLFITAIDLGGDQWNYYVYLANKEANVSNDPTEWGISGASVHVGTSFLYKCPYNFQQTGGIGPWVHKSTSNNIYKLDNNESIVYLYKGVGIGVSENFNYGNWNDIPGVYNWINALKVYDGNITPNAIEDAENLGYNKGYDEGYILGINEGTANRESYWKERVPILEYEAREEGYNKGYAKAVNDLGADKVTAFEINIPAIITSIPTAAKSIINNVFGFEVFGINIAGLLSVAIIVGIVSFVIREMYKK